MEKNHLDRGKRKTYFSKEIEYMRQNQEKKKKKIERMKISVIRLIQISRIDLFAITFSLIPFFVQF